MDTLIKALDKRDFIVTMDENRDESFVTILGEKIRFGIREGSNQRDREPTVEEKK